MTGRDGLLKALTKSVIETAVDEELPEHLGYDEHGAQGRNLGNSRNGQRTKTVLTDNAGQITIDVPRDRDSRSNRSRSRNVSADYLMSMGLFCRVVPKA